jgi:hypothetical protein
MDAARNRDVPNPLLGVVLRVGVFVFVALVLIAILPGLMQPIAGYLVAAALGTFAAAAIANALALRIYERGRLSDIGLGWSRASRRNLSLGLLGGIGAALVVLLGPVVVRVADLRPIPHENTKWASLLFVSIVLLFGAVGEEMLFRGYAFQILIRAIGPFATILPVSVIFGLAHMSNPNATLLGIINTALWGVLFGYAFLLSGDLWLPIGLHFGWNWTLPLLGANLSGSTMEVTGYSMHWSVGNLWSGGAYGPEGGLLTTVIVLLLFYLLHKAPIQKQDAFLLHAPRSSKYEI